jgi:FixJ family two-component response regulator
MIDEPTVHLVDDDPSFLPALSRLLRTAGFTVSSWACSVDFLREMSPQARGCVVIDLEMPGLSGLELQAELTNAGISMPVIFLTGRADIPSTVRAMRGGARDFLEKNAPLDVMIASLNSALARDAGLWAERVRAREISGRFVRLTLREREVLQQVVAGRMNKQIAATLGINERTVKLHRTAITTKIGVHSVAQLAVLTRESGLFAASPATFP